MHIWEKYKALVYRNCTSSLEEQNGLPYWRNELFANILIYLLPLGVLALIPGIIMSVQGKLLGLAVLDFMVVAVAALITFIKHVSVKLRKVAFISILYILAITLLYFLGSFGPGLLYLLSITVFTVMIFSQKAGYFTVAINTIICIVFGVIHTGGVAMPQYSIGSWIAISINLLVVSMPIAALLPKLFNGLQQTIIKLKQVQAALKNQQEITLSNEKRFRALVESSNDIIALLDIEGKISYVNPAVKRIIGYTPAEVIGKSFAMFVTEDLHASSKEVLTNILMHPGVSFPRNTKFIHKDGHEVIIEGTITNLLLDEGVQAIVGNYRDITPLKRAEQQKEFDNKNLKALINNTGDLMWSVDTNLKLITCNDAFMDVVGLATGKIIKKGSNILDYCFPEETYDRYAGYYKKAFAGEQFTELEFFDLPPQPLWNEISMYPIRNENTVIGTACHSRNITRRKLAEIESDKVIADVIQRNKDLEQFSFIVSHNLRAPVANIIGLVAELSKDNDDNEIKKTLTEALSSSTTQLDNVISDLNLILQVNRSISEKKETVYLQELVENIEISIHTQMLKGNVCINKDFGQMEELLTIKSYLHSIFYNLISNSIKYSQPGLPPIIEIKSGQIDGKKTIIFKDNGRGIDLEKNGMQVFKLYKRFHNDVEGKGMGLFMVKAQVEKLGGKITINSAINKGTEFIIEF